MNRQANYRETKTCNTMLNKISKLLAIKEIRLNNTILTYQNADIKMFDDIKCIGEFVGKLKLLYIAVGK